MPTPGVLTATWPTLLGSTVVTVVPFGVPLPAAAGAVGETADAADDAAPVAGSWVPGGNRWSEAKAHSPRPSALGSPSFCPSLRIATWLPGAARPAITTPPAGLTRTISNCGPGAGGCPAAGAVASAAGPAAAV